MGIVKRGLRLIRQRLGLRNVKRVVLQRFPNVLHAGRRAVCKQVSIGGIPHLKKTFESSDVGLACYEREMAAHDLFRGRPWFPPVVKRGPRWFIVPLYPAQSRLDRVSPQLNESARLGLAKEAVEILFEIFLEGYAHRDFHAKNLFLVDGQLILSDFEVLEAYPEGRRPAFPASYDIIGEGLESPFWTSNMCYMADDYSEVSLKHVLGVPVEQALKGITEDLKEELRVASMSFRTHRRRHTCRAQRIYCCFSLPYLSVTNEEAQRDSARRLERFRMEPDSLCNKTVLDLGSNIGGMLFEVQKWKPSRCVGIEYDFDKVAVGTKVAAYNGLNNVCFMQKDIEKSDVESLGGQFDVVLCLAMEAHIRKKRNLYRLLAQAAREILYFEGNAPTDPGEVRARLLQNGFAHVEYLGLSDDDCIAENNRRHLLVARK